MAIEIKNRFTGAVLFRSETAETVKAALIKGIAAGANLADADLAGAYSRAPTSRAPTSRAPTSSNESAIEDIKRCAAASVADVST